MELSKEQTDLLESLGQPTAFAGLDDDAMIAIEDALSDAMQLQGVNDAGDGLNEYGELCRSTIIALSD